MITDQTSFDSLINTTIKSSLQSKKLKSVLFAGKVVTLILWDLLIEYLPEVQIIMGKHYAKHLDQFVRKKVFFKKNIFNQVNPYPKLKYILS